MRRRTPEERYNDNVRTQQRRLEEFAEYEYGWADDLMLWYRVKKLDMPDDVYRACAFFRNREYRSKPGALSLLYQMCKRCDKELPKAEKENAFDLLRFKYMMYAKVLVTGGFGG